MNEAVLYHTVDYVCTHTNNTKFICKFLQTRDQNKLTFKTIALVFVRTKPVVFVRNLNLTVIQILAK